MSNKTTSLTMPPDGYTDWLLELRERIHAAQQRAALAVNQELVLLYWQIGQDILARQADEGWGAKVIDRLAHDLGRGGTGIRAAGGCRPRHLVAAGSPLRGLRRGAPCT